MADLAASHLELVDIRQIHASDRLFALTPEWFPVDRLQVSIEQVGILVPLRVESLENTEIRIISGFRRFKAAQSLAISELPCVFERVQTPLETFLRILWENLGSRHLHELEKASAVWKLRRLFGMEEVQLIQQMLPALDVRPDRHHYELCLRIAGLPEPLQKAVLLRGLHVKTALRLSEWSDLEQRFLVEVVERYQLGKNKQRELCETLQELRMIEKADARAIWERSGAINIDREERLSPADRFSRIKEVLHRLRFPRLSRQEARFHELRSALRLPQQAHLKLPAYFEGNQVNLAFQVRSAAELRSVLEKTRNRLNCEELDEIFELL